jgi:peroxiredoxin
VLYVMSGNQVNPKAVKFIRDHRLPFVFLVDADHHVIDRFGVYNDEFHEKIEEGVPHPTTYVLDREGIVRLRDTRKDFQIWLSASVLRDALTRLP